MDLISGIAWPVVILAVALLYWKPLTRLAAAGLTYVRAGSIEFAWDQAKAGIERPMAPATGSTRHLRSSVEPSTSPESLLGSDLAELAESDPRQAVFGAYVRVRQELERALKASGVSFSEPNTLDALSLARLAESSGLTPPTTTDAVVGLNVLHNLAKHAPGSELSEARAFEYLAMADGALYSLAAALERRPLGSSAEAA